jgi:hypothetical protein
MAGGVPPTLPRCASQADPPPPLPPFRPAPSWWWDQLVPYLKHVLDVARLTRAKGKQHPQHGAINA